MSKTIVNIISKMRELREHYGDDVVCNDEYIGLKNSLSKFLCNESGKMFSIIGETWNPITGCLHYCCYCWARFLATSRLKSNSKKCYHDFKPYFHEDELKRTFRKGIVFVVDMGDIFSPKVKDEWIREVIRHIAKFPNTYFLFLTKNPSRYFDFIDEIPRNAILGATIETNDDSLYAKEKISAAPLPSPRYEAMKNLKWHLKFISIEPIIDFDIDIFTKWIKDINPFLIYIGYDNYKWRLPEPPLQKTNNLIEETSKFTCVINKTIRKAWNEDIETNNSLNVSIEKYGSSNYERFKKYLYIMHKSSLDIVNGLNKNYKKFIFEKFFKNFYRTEHEHYWTLKKLFSLAMYIPMFLQRGMSASNKGGYDGLIDFETHAGPGLAKVGVKRDEIVLGAPLLALKWPKIISEQLKTFKKVSKGFDKMFFIERDNDTYEILKRVVKVIGDESVKVLHGDSNDLLKKVKEEVNGLYKTPLILMFIDPFGELNNQLLHKNLFDFVKDFQVDIIFTINARSLARGLEGKKQNSSDLEKTINDLWGDLFLAPRADLLSEVFKCMYDQSYNINEKSILDAYICRFRVDGYKFVETAPVEFKSGGTIYHLLFASKSKGSYKWMNNYINYLRTRAPKYYNVLKNLWLQTTRQIDDLSKYIPRS
ncbi:MAG: three-Cys-motif partner protein TcmP [Candidatus Methanomethylicia archaeon]